MAELLLNSVLELYRANKWREILKLNENSEKEEALRLSWVWLSEENLNFIKKVALRYSLKGITSLGCGCGLLEWVIQKSTGTKKYIITQSKCLPGMSHRLGLHVTGYEINKEWWESKYSIPHFIELQYIQRPFEEYWLDPNYALLFCYFNNRPSFLEYISNYKGKVVFIIGPGKDKGRHTDPEPFKPNFGSKIWRIYKFQEVKDTKDFVVAYVKCNI